MINRLRSISRSSDWLSKLRFFKGMVGAMLVTVAGALQAEPVVTTTLNSTSWTSAGSLPGLRSLHTATLLANGQVLVAGGHDGSPVAAAHLFNPAAGTWTVTGSMPASRFGHTAVRLANGKVLVSGGYGAGNAVLQTSALYDPALGTWAVAGNQALPRVDHTMTLLADGRVLIAGGRNSSIMVAVSEIFDPATGLWTNTASLSVNRWASTATLLADGRVLLVGGDLAGGNSAAASAEIYNPATSTWASAASLTSARYAHAAVLLPNGKVLVAGGFNNTTTQASTEIYDPAAGVWSSAGSMSSARGYANLTLLSNGQVLTSGGRQLPSTSLSGAEIYSPASSTWASTGSLATVRYLHTTTLLPDGRVLVTGGSNASPLSSTEILGSLVGGAEGATITQSGTFSDVAGNATVTLTASSGTVTPNNAAGTWSWSPVAGFDGPATSPVTITATNSNSQVATTGFTFAPTNAAPAVGISAAATAFVGQSVNFTFTATDAATADQTAGFAWSLNYGDGTSVQTVSAGTASPLARTHTFMSPGTYTVAARATDKDGGLSANATASITVSAPAPTVASILPNTGSTAGGTPVTITGTNFTGATAVTIGGASATSVSVTNATTITAVTPARSAGSASVLVTTPGGTNAANSLFNYIDPVLAASYPDGATVPVTTAGFTATGHTVNFTLGYAPVTGTNLTVVNNTSRGFISGQFSNLVQGQVVSLTYSGQTYRFVANYYGGNGNDLVLHWAGTRLMSWGHNLHGQLGNNDTADNRVPVEVVTTGVLAGKTVIAVSAGLYHSLALCSDGTVAAWGINGNGQLGNGTTTTSRVPVAVDQTGVLAGRTVIAVSAGEAHSLALCSDGRVVAWGLNANGRLGDNSGTQRTAPVLVNNVGVLAGRTVIAISAGLYHSLALCSDGTLAAWGYNFNGQLGDSTNTDKIVPTQVTASGALAGKTVTAIAAGNHNLVICSDGTVAAWGKNDVGQLGDNSNSDRNVPVLVNTAVVLAGKTVTAVTTGSHHSLALCSDSTLATWGSNMFGQLGNSGSSNSSIPVEVNRTGVLSGKTVTSVGAGIFQNVVQCQDGTASTWGNNFYAQLGNNATLNTNVPVLVSTITRPAGDRFVGSAAGAAGHHDFVLVASPAPAVSAISPNSGSTAGGTSVTITGTNFTGATAVTIGGAPATSVSVTNATTITALTPSGSTGAVSVVVTTPAGSNAANTLYTYTLPNVAPVITSNGGGASASINVAENSTAVTTVTATDADLPAQTLTYGKSGADAALFTIHPTTGVLTFTAAPNYESPADAGLNNIYDVTVTATDSGTPALVGTQNLSITVTNVNEAPVIKPSASFLAYETSNPTRNSSELIAYTFNNAVALAGQPFNRVRYRMQNTRDGVAYYADSSFDAWGGLTVEGLKVPDANNIVTTRLNVTNVSTFSNHPLVVNSNTATGRLEHWTNNYAATGNVGGSQSLYDYDDTPQTPIVGYGSFQLHNLSTPTPHTVLAWNNHGFNKVPEVGFGNSTIGIHPDWTFTETGTTNWSLQIYIENNFIPPAMSFTEDVVGNILFFNSPFVDDSASLTVTLAVTGGTLTGNAGSGITVGGSATARTFTGTVAALNTYFTTAGLVTYQGPLNSTASQTLTVTVFDGSQSTSATSTLRLAPVNDTPTDITLTPSSIAENNAPNAVVGTLSTTDVDLGDTHSYLLVAGGGSTHNNRFSISGSTLSIIPSADYETLATYSIRVRSTDAGLAFVEKNLFVYITDVPEQEIEVRGNSVEISSGDTTPRAEDHTNFGGTAVAGGTVQRSFTITNVGTGSLNLTGTAPNYVTLTGDTAHFSVTTQPPVTSLAASVGTTFVVTFDPTSGGAKSATVSIANNDSNESPYTFAITGEGRVPEPIPSTTGDVVTNGGAPGTNGSTNIGQYGVLRRGGFLAENGYLVFPGFLQVGSGTPAVTTANSSGVWKTAGGPLFLVARTGTTVPDVAGAQFATLPEVPGASEAGDVSLLGTLVIGSGGVTTANDTGLWSEIGGGGLRLLMREDDNVPPVAGAKVAAFASGLYATARTGASTGEAVFSVTMKGSSTKTALLRASVNGGTTSVGVIAQEGNAVPGVTPVANYASVAGNFTDPGRMDGQGNFVYSALTTPGNKEGIWYQPVTGGTPSKVFFGGETAPGTGGSKFLKIQRPSMGSNGYISFRASLEVNGDNSGGKRNDGIWAGSAATPGSIQCILRRGDGQAVVSNLPAGALVGNPWGGWLTNSNRGAWRAWLDLNGNGDSVVAEGDVQAIYTNLSGAMQLAVRANSVAPGSGGATLSGFDLPVVGGNNQYAFLGTLSGTGVTTDNNAGLWKSGANGGVLSLVIRKGDTLPTTAGSKVVMKIDLPASNMTDRRWEQPVMDSTGRMLVIVTFTDGSSSQILVP